MQRQRSWARALLKTPVVRRTRHLPYIHFFAPLLFPQDKIYLETLRHKELNSGFATPKFKMGSCIASASALVIIRLDITTLHLLVLFWTRKWLEHPLQASQCCSEKAYLDFNTKPMIPTSLKDVAVFCNSSVRKCCLLNQYLGAGTGVVHKHRVMLLALKIASFKRNI